MNHKKHCNFTHLHVHTIFSIRDALSDPRKLVDQAKKMGFNALAITDHGNMGGHYQFALAASKDKTLDNTPVSPIKPILGVEAYLCEDINKKEHISVYDNSGNKRGRRPKHHHIILLAKNEIGYENLKKMSYISAVDGYYYEPRIDWNILTKYSEGLICSSACLAGEIASSISSDNNKKSALDIADRYKQLFKDDFYLEIQYHGIPAEKDVYSNIIEIADELSIPLIATNDVHYIFEREHEIHNQFITMKFKRDEKQGGSSDIRNLEHAYKEPEFFLKSVQEMENIFYDRMDAINNTQEIVEKCEYKYKLENPIIWPQCNIEIDKKIEKWRDKYFPELSIKQAFLLKKSMDGLKNLGLNNNPIYVNRLKHEWNIIFDMGYEEYFITQLKVCEICKENNIMVGPGRGSVCGSLAMYSLGITKIDPIKFGLIFERFLNPSRGIWFNHNLPIFDQNKIDDNKI